ncbi:tetratricopeptide repeat protein [Altererythrobacter sp. MF3-039]|uniref:tetratricopeptide repeat protein n=1 Tax=Altererythrobacter sp. MF3-039 TaxID=3252901 RepID=UPI00390CCB94
MMTIDLKQAALALVAIAGLSAPLAAHETVTVGPYEITTFDPANHSQEPTECDKLASHPEDPFSVWEGKSSSRDIDLPAAIEACRKAVEADPANPRLNYQLGRVYGYSQRGDEAMPYRNAAIEGGYPQSLFVIGYIYIEGMNIEQDVCLGAELMRLSAFAGRFAGQVGFPHYVLSGRFDDCPVTKDTDEMLGMLAAAKPQGFYQNLLVASLKERVASAE